MCYSIIFNRNHQGHWKNKRPLIVVCANMNVCALHALTRWSGVATSPGKLRKENKAMSYTMTLLRILLAKYVAAMALCFLCIPIPTPVMPPFLVLLHRHQLWCSGISSMSLHSAESVPHHLKVSATFISCWRKRLCEPASLTWLVTFHCIGRYTIPQCSCLLGSDYKT